VPIDEFTTLEGYAYIPSRGMLIRSAVWDEVGGMDPRYYPVVWADGDFCAALAHHDHRFRLVAEARQEFGGQLAARLGVDLVGDEQQGGATPVVQLHQRLKVSHWIPGVAHLEPADLLDRLAEWVEHDLDQRQRSPGGRVAGGGHKGERRAEGVHDPQGVEDIQR
jgi:hypothetical protein